MNIENLAEQAEELIQKIENEKSSKLLEKIMEDFDELNSYLDSSLYRALSEDNLKLLSSL